MKTYLALRVTPSWSRFSVAYNGAMQIQVLLKQNGALDTRNAKIVLSAQQLLQEGKVNQACDELRRIERRVAAHPAVVQLRRNLVAALYGWELEMPVTRNGNGSNGHPNGNANGNGEHTNALESAPRAEVATF